MTTLLSCLQPSWAVKHIHPELYPNAAKDKVHQPSKATIKKFGSLRAAIVSSTTGPLNVAVIIVQFPAGDPTLISGSRSIQSLVNIDSYFTGLAAYFAEASYCPGPTCLTLNFKFYGNTAGAAGENSAVLGGVYTLVQPMEYYGCGDEGLGCTGVTTPTSGSISANGDYLLADALTIARGANPTAHPGLTSAAFDAVIVMHAGNGNETTGGTEGDIWSIFYSQDTIITTFSAGSGFDEGDVVPETEASGITSPLGVMAHEFGHELGLPDLYNTGVNGGTSVVGDWEIMDSGPFTGNGANPAHPSAWDKVFLGWATPTTITSRTSTSLGFSETGATNMIKLPVQNGLSQEYFLIEYRSRLATGASYDHNIPGDGLLIWHVDDAITTTRGVEITDPTLSNTVNTGSPHYGVSIVTADGVTISNSNQGDSANPFGANSTFTSPQSDNFSNQPSGITVANIRAGSGTPPSTFSFDVLNLAVTSGQTIEKVVNFPNPAGKGYSHPSGEGHTTIQFHLGRPARDYQINIYTLSGDLVRKIDKDQITLNATRSADEKWVYEFVWDLKNGDGAMVAPGVYLYLIRADGQKKSNKAVIIR